MCCDARLYANRAVLEFGAILLVQGWRAGEVSGVLMGFPRRDDACGIELFDRRGMCRRMRGRMLGADRVEVCHHVARFLKTLVLILFLTSCFECAI